MALWVSDYSVGRVIRIDATSGELATSLEIGGRVELMISDRGHIWMADHTNDEVLVFDSVTSRLEGRVPIGETAVAMVATSGAVWIAGGAGEVLRVPVSEAGDPESSALTHSLVSPSLGQGEAVIGFGVVGDQPWVIGNNGTAIGLEPSTGQVITTVETGLEISRISRSGDAIWVGSPSGVLSLLDLRAFEVTTVVEPSVLSAPGTLEVEGDSLWVSNRDTLFHLDATSGEVITSFELAPELVGIEVAPAVVWLTYSASIVGLSPDDGRTLVEVAVDGASLGAITLS